MGNVPPPPPNLALIAALIKIAIAVGTIMLMVPMIVWLERKVIADFQARIGPSRVGPFGLLQSFADGIKLLMKEALVPASVDRLLYYAAPFTVMIPALVVAAVVP
ncbi:MAG TPA: NADH-quinone oxidoreductase subunit H, partial [Armatimonadota bacterium]|nr:NADH-quinone oxidoreductase subunit H [Armatimonadota bacterium]